MSEPHVYTLPAGYDPRRQGWGLVNEQTMALRRSAMNKPFMIRHPETRREYEMSDPAYFVAHYQPQGFEIVDPAPTGYRVPELPAADAEPVETDPHRMKRDALNAYAASLGIEGAEHYPNKDALLTAVDAALSATDDEGEDA